MILVDTSVWIDHFRTGDGRLAQLLENGSVLMHPFVFGELALGNLRNAQVILQALAHLPPAEQATDPEVMRLIDTAHLAGSGIGYVDAHLLTAVRLTPDTRLWTRDRRLQAVAERLGIDDR